jgi:hypothetical protein
MVAIKYKYFWLTFSCRSNYIFFLQLPAKLFIKLKICLLKLLNLNYFLEKKTFISNNKIITFVLHM